MAQAPILIPTREIRIAGGVTVTVREMAWPAALEFMRTLSVHVKKLVVPMLASGKVSMQTVLASVVDQLPDLVAGADEVSLLLLRKATDLSPEAIQSLGVREAMTILDAAIELNLNPEIIEQGKALAGRVSRTFQSPTSTAGSAPSSNS